MDYDDLHEAALCRSKADWLVSINATRLKDKTKAIQLQEACVGTDAIVQKVECKNKSDKPPALYDLTTFETFTSRIRRDNKATESF